LARSARRASVVSLVRLYNLSALWHFSRHGEEEHGIGVECG
jgi:hypothetical protein